MCWTEELSKFNFIIDYWSKKKETQSDVLLRWEQNIFKEADSCFTHREMQLLKSEMFKKTNCVNAFIVLNIHIFLSEEKKSDNKQEEVVVFEQDSRLCEAHFEISLSKLKNT